MIEIRPKDSFWESPKVKFAVALVLIIFFVAIYFIQRRLAETGGSAGTAAHPAPVANPGAARLPVPETPDATRPQYPLDSWTNPAPPETKMPDQTPTQPLPSDPAMAPRTETHTLAAPITEVHPLSDAEAIMGAPSSEVGQIGVTRTFKLPEGSTQSKTLPLPKDKQP